MEHDDEYTVGYGRPPIDTQFRKGRSGNPKGRPKRSRNLKTDLLEELGETIRVREGDREFHVTKQRAMVKAVVAKAIKGDTRAVTALLGLYTRLLGLAPTEDEEQPLSPPDQRVLDDLVNEEIARRKREGKKGAKRSVSHDQH